MRKKVVVEIAPDEDGTVRIYNPATGAQLSYGVVPEGLLECLEPVPVDDLIRLKESGFEPEGLVKLRKAGVL
ncbi:hypothetical protein [Maridesulfovibrio sp.]|uniref:hypothetical protein n=1 Tax=Maridesulfovibrio sp. TaxID=2795000 RepID=UPI002AA82AFA|nr:hypothetical protein [Maridesulfovibrio sp.]